MDICPILEEIGSASFTSPLFASCIMGASIISESAGAEIKEKILPLIADGDAIITLAFTEFANGWSEDSINMTAEKEDNEYILSGTKLFVPFADASNYIICCARDNSTDKASLFLVDSKAEGLDCLPLQTFSTERYNKVVFEKVRVSEENIIGQLGHGFDIIEKLMPLLVVSRCVEMIGGLQKTLEMTIQYIKERKQFGVPLGSFQALQHKCSEMAIDIEASKYITYKAAWKLSENLPCRKDVSMAKAWTGDAFQRVSVCAHQLHGAMGFTEESDLHFYYKQAKSMQLMYGGSSYHRKIVAEETGY